MYSGSALNIQQCTLSHPYIFFSERRFKCILKSPSNYLNFKLCKTLSVSGYGLQYCVRHFAVLGHTTGRFRQAGLSVYRQFFLEEYFRQLVIYIYIYIMLNSQPLHASDIFSLTSYCGDPGSIPDLSVWYLW